MQSLEQRRLNNLQEAQGEVPPISKIRTINTTDEKPIKEPKIIFLCCLLMCVMKRKKTLSRSTISSMGFKRMSRTFLIYNSH